MISEAFASILRAGRDDFNARFAEARRQFPGLGGDEFGAFLQTAVNDVVTAVAAVRPERTAETASVAYDVALELVGQGLVGHGARQGFVEEGWRRILPAASLWVAEAPARMLAAVCNALHHLAITPGARPGQWIGNLEHLAVSCSCVDEFLKCGQIAAWRAGLAHFRVGAIEVANALPEPLARAALGVSSSVAWTNVRDRLERDPWFNPTSADQAGADADGHLRLVWRAGAFKGFGGLFPEPPRVTAFGEHFLVSSGGECWLLIADHFGATFHRADPGEFDAAKSRAVQPSGIDIAGTAISRNGVRLDLSELGSFASVAANRHTLALTSSLTHAVVLLALT
jgi:hypothetical protein